MSGLTETAIEPGHSLRLLLDGPSALASMVTDISDARESVVVQSYSCAPGLVMHRITTLLMEKARQGLQVLVEVTIAQVSRTHDFDLGVSYSGVKLPEAKNDPTVKFDMPSSAGASRSSGR